MQTVGRNIRGRDGVAEFRQSREECGLIAEYRRGGVVGMACLPVRKYEHARAQLADDARDLEPVGEGVFDTAIGNVERLPPTNFQDARSLVGLARAVFNGAARAHLALREVEDGGAVSALGHLEQRAAAGLLDVVAVRGDGKNVAVWRVGHRDLQPQRHRDAVAQRNDRREPILRRVQQAVELHDALRCTCQAPRCSPAPDCRQHTLLCRDHSALSVMKRPPLRTRAAAMLNTRG